ncbi:MAG TPA: glycosyltransferase family 4 protein [Gemmatimonadaceae bacterium]
MRDTEPYEAFISLLGGLTFESLRASRASRAPAKELRIAYVLWSYPTLSETFVRREIEALRKAGLHIEVFAREGPTSPLFPDTYAAAGPVTYFGPPDEASSRAATRVFLRRDPALVTRLWLYIVRHRYRSGKTWWHDRDVLYQSAALARVLEEHGITHIHAPWASQPALLAFVASRMLGVGYSVQARASEIHRNEQAPLVADRLRFADFIVTNSRYNEQYLRQRIGGRGTPPIKVVYNGLDLDRIPRVERVTSGASALRLLSVGRLVEAKGFRYLLMACRALHDRGLDFTCQIIGGPQDPDDTVTWVELRKLHSSLRLESIVCFTGPASFSDILSAYRHADLFVLPCIRARDGSHDVTPNTLIEAMAMSLPVISTTSGAIPEIVDHEMNGLLVPPADERALADTIERLIRDSSLRQRLGEAARRKVEDRFDIARNTPARAALFQASASQPHETQRMVSDAGGGLATGAGATS